MPSIAGTPPIDSYVVTNSKRDISDVFTALLQTDKGILSLITEGDRPKIAADGKMEWFEDVIQYETDTINNGGVAVLAAHTSFIVANIGRWAVGMIAKFRNYEETFKVTNVDTGLSTLTVSRNYNGLGATATVPDLDPIDIINRPELEGSTGHFNGAYEPSAHYNYYEIFREDLPHTEGVTDVQMYGFADGNAWMNYQIDRMMRMVKKRLDNAIMYGERSAPTRTSEGTMRGIYTWLRQAGTNKTSAGGAALSAAQVNTLLGQVYTDDPNGHNIVMVMNLNQAVKFAGFNTSTLNRMQIVEIEKAMTGGNIQVSQFVPDIPAFPGVRIIVDLAAPNKAILFLNTSKIKLVYAPHGRMRTWQWKIPGAVEEAGVDAVYMKASLEMKDSLYSHALLYNLAI